MFGGICSIVVKILFLAFVIFKATLVFGDKKDFTKVQEELTSSEDVKAKVFFQLRHQTDGVLGLGTLKKYFNLENASICSPKDFSNHLSKLSTDETSLFYDNSFICADSYSFKKCKNDCNSDHFNLHIDTWVAY